MLNMKNMQNVQEQNLQIIKNQTYETKPTKQNKNQTWPSLKYWSKASKLNLPIQIKPRQT